MYERPITGVLRRRLTAEPRRFIQIVLGPRQVGKTTSVQSALRDVTLPVVSGSADIPGLQSSQWLSEMWVEARKAHDASKSPVILFLDEIQKVTDWSALVKRLWDEDTWNERDIRVVLTGSSPLLMQQGLSESLAGRFEVIRASHWTWPECREAFGWDVDTFIYHGGYPGAASLIDEPSRWRDYITNAVVETSVSRDILLMTRIDKPALLRQVFSLACEYAGQMLTFEKMLGRLQDAGKTYEHDGALWLKSTDYGDDKDRVMRKGDGSYTYFVPDVAYHIDKWQRGFTKVVNIQGTDHHGTIARVRAGLQAADVGIPQGYPEYVLNTMVRVTRGGEEVKLSKRAGSYVTLRDLIEWTSKDAVRFFLLSRKPDTEYVFDVDLALAQNNDNPVYYVQYAHARICSVLAAWGGDVATLKDVDLAPLQSPQAQALMLVLAKYPDMLADAARDFAPHDVTFYLRELAAAYHSYYGAERILVDDQTVKQARLALVAATARVLHNGLQVLGVNAPQKM